MRFRDNQYQGVNAHLHSYLQQHSEWSMFHSNHIVDIQQALQGLLPPETGYFVVSERSIQLIRDDLLTGGGMSRVVPDVGVYKSGGQVQPAGPQQATVPGAVVSIIDTMVEPEHVVGVAIYQADADDVLGNLITRLELLSPANKPPGSHYRQYLAKRDETLMAGINLVEIDYLHERRSPLAILPDYTRHELNAYPYHILVSTPYPSLADGHTAIYGFRVDDPIPPVAIPLAGEESITLDLNAVYNHTYSSNFTYGLRLVDYAQQPEGFQTYSPEDQRHITARMVALSEG